MKELSLYETRIIGCLIEKSLTTPDQYPLSLNALTNACNQKSNREPVMSLTENQVQDAVQGLEAVGLVSAQTGFGSRVSKYLHRFCNTEFGELKLSEQELGVICVLFLRGPQTPGELRTRTNRLCTFAQLSDVESVLDKLASRDSGALVTKLSREPGKREVRYAHLFSSEDWSAEGAGLNTEGAQTEAAIDAENGSSQAEPQQSEPDVLLRVQALESQVAQLLSRIDELENLVLNQ